MNDIKDSATFVSVQTMMESQHVYRDVDLNLNRLARKLGIPTRQVSTAINRATGKNVSQYVNEFRISEACGLLDDNGKAGDRDHVRGRVPDQVQLQPGVPAGDRDEPSRMA